MNLRTFGLAIGLLLFGSSPAHGAPAYPAKPITLVVPFSAGSGTDQVARGLSQVLSHELGGATIVIENKPGASGMIGAQTAARAPADGYTVLLTTNTTQSANPYLFSKLPYDPVADFAPIAAIARGSMVLVVPATGPVKSVAELIAAGKAKSLTFGAGNSSSRVAAEMFSQMAGAKVVYVPYKSNPQAVTDLVGGQMDFMFADTATALPLVTSGKLKALAYAGDKRTPALPDLPTLDEAGIKGYALFYWVAAYAPKGTPPEIVHKLNDILVRSVQTPAIQAIYAQAVLDVFTTTPDELARFQRAETEKWGRVIKAAGITPE